jgi:hypothetical protein
MTQSHAFVPAHEITFANLRAIIDDSPSALFLARATEGYKHSIPLAHRAEAVKLALEAISRLRGKGGGDRCTAIRNSLKAFIEGIEGTLDSKLIKGGGDKILDRPVEKIKPCDRSKEYLLPG